ncbi:hypothetical protein D3C87_991770 [compost metagenome]
MAGQVFATGRAAHATAGASEETEHVGNRRNLVVERGAVGFAAVIGFELGQFFAVGFDGVGEFEQQQRAIFRRSLRPAVERGVGGAHGGIDLGFAGFVDFHQHTAQRRVEYRLGGAFAVEQLAVDQELGLHGMCPLRSNYFSLWKPVPVGTAAGCDLLIFIFKKTKSKDRSLRQLLQG